jgi:hypothetical protein
VTVGEFDGEFDVLAVVLLADLFRLFLHKGREGIEVAGDILSRFFLAATSVLYRRSTCSPSV